MMRGRSKYSEANGIVQNTFKLNDEEHYTFNSYNIVVFNWEPL